MKKIFIPGVVVAALSVEPVSAGLLIHEDFNYATGSIGGQAATGTGLTGNWSAGATGGSGSSGIQQVQDSSLVFAGHFAASGGSIQLSNGGPGWGEAGAGVAVAATLTGYSTLFASSIQTMDIAGGYYPDWVVEQRFNTAADGNWSSSLGRNIVSAFNSGYGSTRNGGVSVDSGEVQSAGMLNTGTEYLLVTAYTIIGPEITSATLYAFDETAYGNYLLNTTAGTAVTDLSTYAIFYVTDTGTASLNSFNYLQFVSMGGPTGHADDFRLGTQIFDVVNVAPVPEPSTLALLGLGVLSLGLFYRRK